MHYSTTQLYRMLIIFSPFSFIESILLDYIIIKIQVHGSFFNDFEMPLAACIYSKTQ